MAVEGHKEYAKEEWYRFKQNRNRVRLLLKKKGERKGREVVRRVEELK